MSRRGWQGANGNVNPYQTFIRDPQTTEHVELLDPDGKKIDPLLYNLCATATPHGMEPVLEKYLPWLSRTDLKIDKDGKGNIWVQIGNPGTDFNTLFSCHTDTVVSEWVAKNQQIELFMSKEVRGQDNKVILPQGMIYAGYYTQYGNQEAKVVPCVLGADDKVGVYIMCKMIEANIPGLYIFHIGEERGCIGSQFIADTPALNERISVLHHAVAFDRKNYGDVVTRQRGAPCCSTEFSKAFAEQLNRFMPAHQLFKDAEGTSTDTANYIWSIPECTNLSVGYFDAHGAEEHFDYVWLNGVLVPALVALGKENAFAKLPSIRSKEKPKPVVHTWNDHHRNGNSSVWPINPVNLEEIDADTPYSRLPKWSFKDGYQLKASYVGNERLIRRALSLASGHDGDSSAQELVGMYASLINYKREVEALRAIIAHGAQDKLVSTMNALARTDNLVSEWMHAYVAGKVIKVDTSKIALTGPELDARKKALDITKAGIAYKKVALNIRVNYTITPESENDLAKAMVELVFRMAPYRFSTSTLNKSFAQVIKFIDKFKDKNKEFADFAAIFDLKTKELKVGDIKLPAVIN